MTSDRVRAVIGVLLLFVLVTVPRPRLLGARLVGQALLGQPRASDFTTDFLGAQGLLHRGEPYPILGPALEALGAPWPVYHRSTHPPTAFLMVVPLTALRWSSATVVWIVAMLSLVAISVWAARLSWPATLAFVGLMVIWPPGPWSLFQLTPIWLLASVLAWRWADRPLCAGAVIGAASLTKFFPGITLLPYVRARRWAAISGFTAVWAASVGLVVWLNAAALPAYMTATREGALAQIARPDNGALVAVAWRLGGWVAVLLSAGLVAVLVRIAGRSQFDEAWAIWVWLSVALLPVAWNYSLLPLLPWLLRTMQHRSLAQLVAGLAIGLAFLSPGPNDNGIAIAASIALAGVAFGLAGIQIKVARRLTSEA